MSAKLDGVRFQGTKVLYSPGEHTLLIEENVAEMRLYGCGGGDGGARGADSAGSQRPGAGGAGGNGRRPVYAKTAAGAIDIPVNQGERYKIIVGQGGVPGQAGTATTVELRIQQQPAHIFDLSGEITLGGPGSAGGNIVGQPGQSYRRDDGVVISGGAGGLAPGQPNQNWGGNGGGGGAGMNVGGGGGRAGCDGGSEIIFPGRVDDPSYRVTHNGGAGTPPMGGPQPPAAYYNGGGGGGGGGGGDTDRAGNPGFGGDGGHGGDGYLQITLIPPA